jgi:AraC-like DNA-binding protein
MASDADLAPLVADLTRLGRALERGTKEARIGIRQLATAAAFSTRKSILWGTITLDRPLVAVVLEGHKEVVHAGASRLLHPADLLVVAGGVTYDATTVPDRRTGRYNVLVFSIGPEVGAALARAHPALCASPALGAFDAARPHVLPADPLALQAVLHVARTLAGGDAPEALLHHRLQDLLLTLSLRHAAAAPTPAASDLVLAVRHLVRADPSAALEAETVSRRLGVSPATLRRRLAAAGVSLRSLRAEERMALAAVLLAQPDARVGDVALRCGYESPSKFARQYRTWFGRAPGRERALRMG